MNAAGGKKNGGSFGPKDFFRFTPIGKAREPVASTTRQKQTMIEAGWIAWSRAAGATVPANIRIRG